MTDMPSRDVTRLETAMRDLTSEISNLRKEWAEIYVRKDVLEPQLELLETAHKATQAQVDRHSDYWDWVIKIVIGAVIIALLGLVIVGQNGGITL